jgi:hypothetical protein
MTFKDLEGKTILIARQMKRGDTGYAGFLELKFTDGTSCVIVYEEYPTQINIISNLAGLVELAKSDGCGNETKGEKQ